MANNNLTVLNRGFSEIVELSRKAFDQVSLNLDWGIEYNHLMVAVRKNDKLMSLAISQPDSFIEAMTNLADLGLSLASSRGFAYLLPRKGKVCLEIGYKGIMELLFRDCGILAITAEEVYFNDRLDPGSFNKEAVLTMGSRGPHDPEGRGKLSGFYCKLKDKNGNYHFCYMSLEEIDKIRASSQSYQSDKKGSPWALYYSEMAKKTLIKRISKMIPRMGAMTKIDRAIEIDNEDYIKEPIDRSKTSSLNDQFGKKENGFDTTNVIPLINEIIELCKKLTDGFTTDQKKDFMKNILGVDDFSEVSKMSPDDLKDLISHLDNLLNGKKE